MSDTLHEVEEMLILDGRLPGGPPPWPKRRWYHTRRWYAAVERAHARTWFAVGQPVRITEWAFAGRAGTIAALFDTSLGWMADVELYGGVVGSPSFATRIGLTQVEWLSPRDAPAAEAADRALVAQATPNPPIEGHRTPLDMEAMRMHAQARQRDGIIHPHRRLQV